MIGVEGAVNEFGRIHFSLFGKMRFSPRSFQKRRTSSTVSIFA